MDFDTFVSGIAILVFVMLIVASFVSKTYVTGLVRHGPPQKMTWFMRIFMFFVGLTGVYYFALAILKQRHVSINPSWLDVGQPLSDFILSALFLSMAVPFLIVCIRDLWLKRKEETRIQRVISICLTLIFLYSIWETTPAIMRKVLTLFHHVNRGGVG